ncbi:MAG: two-component system response regulator FixJ [Planctomycetota bacterium]|jgi:two-component system response regulator FixJ
MTQPQVYIIDDDDAVRDSMSLLFESADIPHSCFESADQFVSGFDGTQRGCLVLDMRMPGLTGLELQAQLNAREARLPIVFITGHGDVPMAVEAMRRGAVDFLRKPVNEGDFLERIQQALQLEADGWNEQRNLDQIKRRVATLTARECEVFALVGEGSSNKLIASNLGISERTVEVHRSQVMKKLEVTTLAQLVRIHLQWN